LLFAVLMLEAIIAPAKASRLFFLCQALDRIIALNSSPSPALVALRRILSSTKLSDVQAFPETSSLPNW
jgi:hypothetical protein